MLIIAEGFLNTPLKVKVYNIFVVVETVFS